ncbi:phospholipid-transporting ATPase ABCA3-like isoform X1 [Haliotis rubra]|uniref:phospholipid-transporting ATPase ABCA3-like isoform X1 n=2 Tax=Haliotis rubra TaxID=36100 RepID=UPI001EE58C1D|nr:phospholipid-transporting ATPase ABCA3-like isoform X1 [Haliotis rubra]
MPLFFAVLFLLLRFNIKITPKSEATLYDDFPVTANGTVLDWKGSDLENIILYTPNTTLLNNLMTQVEIDLGVKQANVTVMGFATPTEMLRHYKFHPANITYAVEFNVSSTATSLPTSLHYSLRPKMEDWNTDSITSFSGSNAPRDGTPDYRSTGFLLLQKTIDEAIIKEWNTSASDLLDNLDLRLQRMPFPPYREDGMASLLQIMFPVLLMMSFILMAIQTTKGVVYEKERKLKESMKLMGLSAAAHWASWFLTIFIYILVFSAIYTVACGVNISGNGAVLANSDPSVLMVFLICYGVAIISYCFMISAFTHRATTASAVSAIIYFITYCPYFYLQTIYTDMTRPQKLSSCLLFNVAIGMGANVFGLYEGTGVGVQWSNFDQPVSESDNFSLLDAMLMLLGDTAIHLLITWYIDNVWPGEFGVPKPFYFLFTATYWCGSNQVKPNDFDVTNQDSTHFEKEPTGMQAGISIRNLRKVFSSGSRKKVAVDGMSLNMFEGQISVLLGHNGAGKTTTMSVLTGFIPASGGTAIVNGYDINNDIQSVRQSLGLCPQHNILFDTLTVQEHMQFFANLKGCPQSGREAEIRAMISQVGLDSKRNTQSQHLSGGQKRKLSVGIALIGGSKIVILDEPTSGMDPAARRQTWDILQRNKQGRTMLLTTHFMDEADLLGDRIAIMAEGVVKCCGTSYFLKKLYGAGYHLVMVKEPNCQVASVTAVVQQHVPTAVMESEINAELSYLLPDDQSANFAALFNEIETRRRELGISSFGTTATTMEEVFLKVDVEPSDSETDLKVKTTAGIVNSEGFTNAAMEHPGEEPDENGFGLSNMGSYGALSGRGDDAKLLAFNRGFHKVRGVQLELSRFRGMFIKKMILTLRNKFMTMMQLFIPVIFGIAVFAALTASGSGRKDEGPITLDMRQFNNTIVPYQNGSPPVQLTTDLTSNFVSLFDRTSNKPKWVELDTFTNMSNYFLSTVEDIGVTVFDVKYIIAAEFESNTTARGHYNGQPYHTPPIILSSLLNGILRYFTSPDHSITTTNFPLPQNQSDSSRTTLVAGAGTGFGISFVLIFGMAFLTSSFVHFLIKERQVGAKHLQVVSGVGPFVFWMSNFAWDFINYMIPCVGLLIVFAAFQSEAYVEDGRLGIVFLIFVVYGWAVLPFMYTLQYLFKVPASGMAMIIILNIVTGMFSVMIIFLLTMFKAGSVLEVLDWIFTVLLPHHAFGMTFFEMYINYNNHAFCTEQNYIQECARGTVMSCCQDTCGNDCLVFSDDFLQWELPGIGRFILMLVLHGFFYMSVILMIEYQIPQKIAYCSGGHDMEDGERFLDGSVPEDDDVSAERRRIDVTDPASGSSDAIVLKNLYKRFGDVVAVDHLNIGIAEKECFGLLGQNGAGKTTTFRMMTGEVMVTGGNAYLWKHDIRNQSKKVQENMGYCPQFDALIDQMTGRETLAMYARLRGVPERSIADVCTKLLDIMMLHNYADIPTQEYSGGNKRKLSTAIALVGDPAFIMLDEPSTGMDPKARRQLWNVLSQVRECGRTLVLTSHSMEECDALCTKIAIMVNGRFVCLGTPQHLKNKFGQGYTLIARMAMLADGQNTAPTQPLVDFITSHYPHTQVFDDHQGYAHFQVPDTSVSLAQVFTSMEQAKGQFCVEDYSVHQTTLEQVFLSFTRQQVPPREEPPKGFCRTICCCCCNCCFSCC